jgi:hypothetical protein
MWNTVFISFYPLMVLILMMTNLISVQADFTKDDTRVVISDNNQVLLKYKYGEVPYKPYVEELYSPAGVNFIRDAPFDHLHHHGLMLAITADGINFWEEKILPGLQKTIDLSEVTLQGNDLQTWRGLKSHIAWITPSENKAVLEESREVKVCLDKAQKVTLLSWDTTFVVPAGKESTKLTGTIYHGLGMRFLASMDLNGEFINADAQKGVDGTNAKRSKWCAYSAQADGKPLTVAMFDDTGNLRHPATWFTMTNAFAYMSATLNLSLEPYVLKSGEQLHLRYGIAVWDGVQPAEVIEKVYTKWCAWKVLLINQGGK